MQAPSVVPVVVDEVIKEQDYESMDEQDHILIKWKVVKGASHAAKKLKTVVTYFVGPIRAKS